MSKAETIENYLETIYVLKNKNGSVRSIDISNELGYSKPTISIMIKRYKELGFVNVDDTGYIDLTPVGKEIAERTYERHTVISKILMSIGVSEKIALEDACRMEHCMSCESFEALKLHFLNHGLCEDDFRFNKKLPD